MAPQDGTAKYITFPISALSLFAKSPALVTVLEQRHAMWLIRGLSVWTMAERLELVLLGVDSSDADGSVHDVGAVTDMATRHQERYTPQELGDYFDPGESADCETVTAVQASLELHGLTAADLQPVGGTIAEFVGRMAQSVPGLVHDGGRKRAMMRQDIVDDAIRGELTWREFAVLAAVYAACGRERAAASKVYYEQLAAMASGYGGQHQAAALGVDDERFLTRKQIRTTIDRLWQRGFFAKVPAARGVWVSVSMPEAKLIAYAAAAESRIKSRKSAAENQAELQRQTAQRRQDRKGHHDGHPLETLDGAGGHNLASKRAPGRAPQRAPDRAPTGKTSSGKTLSGKTLSGETSGRRRCRAPQPRLSEDQKPESALTDEPQAAAEPASVTFATLPPAAPPATMTAALSPSPAEAPGSILASLPEAEQERLRLLQRFQHQRRAELAAADGAEWTGGL